MMPSAPVVQTILIRVVSVRIALEFTIMWLVVMALGQGHFLLAYVY